MTEGWERGQGGYEIALAPKYTHGRGHFVWFESHSLVTQSLSAHSHSFRKGTNAKKVGPSVAKVVVAQSRGSCLLSRGLGRVTLGSLGFRLLRCEALKTTSLGFYEKADALETISAPLRGESG